MIVGSWFYGNIVKIEGFIKLGCVIIEVFFLIVDVVNVGGSKIICFIFKG